MSETGHGEMWVPSSRWRIGSSVVGSWPSSLAWTAIVSLESRKLRRVQDEGDGTAEYVKPRYAGFTRGRLAIVTFERESIAAALLEEVSARKKANAGLVVTRLNQFRGGHVTPVVHIEGEGPGLDPVANDFVERPLLVDLATVVDERHDTDTGCGQGREAREGALFRHLLRFPGNGLKCPHYYSDRKDGV